ncbi:MAG: hypothetical protein V1929_07985 [bacterium]
MNAVDGPPQSSKGFGATNGLNARGGRSCFIRETLRHGFARAANRSGVGRVLNGAIHRTDNNEWDRRGTESFLGSAHAGQGRVRETGQRFDAENRQEA